MKIRIIVMIVITFLIFLSISNNDEEMIGFLCVSLIVIFLNFLYFLYYNKHVFTKKKY
jgi:hypothetical protein